MVKEVFTSKEFLKAVKESLQEDKEVILFIDGPVRSGMSHYGFEMTRRIENQIRQQRRKKPLALPRRKGGPAKEGMASSTALESP